jgi:hypothetical protein
MVRLDDPGLYASPAMMEILAAPDDWAWLGAHLGL